VQAAMRTFTYDTFDTAFISQRLPLSGRKDAVHKKQGTVNFEKNDLYLSLKIRTDTLYRLIAQGVLVVDDLRELDQQAQKYIRQLILENLRRKKYSPI
jgi:hypothetical protein